MWPLSGKLKQLSKSPLFSCDAFCRSTFFNTKVWDFFQFGSSALLWVTGSWGVNVNISTSRFTETPASSPRLPSLLYDALQPLNVLHPSHDAPRSLLARTKPAPGDEPEYPTVQTHPVHPTLKLIFSYNATLRYDDSRWKPLLLKSNKFKTYSQEL